MFLIMHRHTVIKPNSQSQNFEKERQSKLILGINVACTTHCDMA